MLRASLDLPKRAELHIAERLLKDVEELLARCDYIKATEKAWAAAQTVNAAKKRAEIRGCPSAKQLAKTES